MPCSSAKRTPSFSIHKRIEGGATIPVHQVVHQAVLVSVSTSGSKGVQPNTTKRNVCLIKCFSIHKRIEGGATRYGGLVKK